MARPAAIPNMYKSPNDPPEPEKPVVVAPPEPEEDPLEAIFISSVGIETKPEAYKNEFGAKKQRHFIYPEVNGEKLKIECNKQVMVPSRYAHVLQGIIEQQSHKD